MKILTRLIDVVTYIVYGVILVGSVFWLIQTLSGWRESSASYNCSVAEISPDFTPAMKNLCRKLRREQQ